MITAMATFTAPDGTRLAYHETGAGRPLICLPGGPMQDTAYLGDLGGLPAHRRLVMLDLRGTGHSATPADPSSYRCDRLVDDVEALREHLGLDQLDLLGHSAGANLAALYATRHPERIGRLVLVTPGTTAVGLATGDASRREIVLGRKDEPWFPAAFAAYETIVAGNATASSWDAITPFFYGRWDAAAQAHAAAKADRANKAAAAVFAAEDAFDPDATRAALAALSAPVLLVAGDADINTAPTTVAEYAALFPRAELFVQPAAGHYPWVDDAAVFSAALARFLT